MRRSSTMGVFPTRSSKFVGVMLYPLMPKAMARLVTGLGIPRKIVFIGSLLMSKTEAQHKIETLRARLADANDQYYKHGHSPMSDEDYDLGVKELERLEAEHPEFAAADSPAAAVGSDLTPGFRKVVHKYPMLSIQNTYSEAELADWHRQVTDKSPPEDLTYVVELKIDGVAMSLVYEDHKLAYAVT